MTDEAGLVEQLKLAAKTSSEVHRQMAEAKSLRQTDNNEGLTDLYMWPTPEQTLEGKAAAALTYAYDNGFRWPECFNVSSPIRRENNGTFSVETNRD